MLLASGTFSPICLGEVRGEVGFKTDRGPFDRCVEVRITKQQNVSRGGRGPSGFQAREEVAGWFTRGSAFWLRRDACEHTELAPRV